MKRTLLVIGVVLGIAAPASADEDVAAFYGGKQIHLIVGSGAGSGYDINARLIARFLGAHIPGHPTVVVQNQPGAGSVIAAKGLANGATRDGTVIASVINGVPTAPLLQPAGVRFDPLRLGWIGSSNRDTQVMYVWGTAPVRRLEELTKKELIVGGTSAGTSQVDFPLVLNAILGTKFKIVSGYEGSAQVHKAMEAGEVQGIAALAWSSLKTINANWLVEGKIRILAQWSAPPHPDLKEVPLVESLAHTKQDLQALKLLTSRLEIGRPFVAPPDVPPARLAALRHAFEATMKDPAFLAEARRIQLDVDPMTGEEVHGMVESVLATPQDVVARVRRALNGN